MAALEAADASQRAATEALGLSVSEQLGALKGSTDERFMQVREVADEHAAHLGRLDDLVATRRTTRRRRRASPPCRHGRTRKREAAAALAEVAAAAEARQSAAEEQLASHASQILDLQVEIQTKASLDGLAELAERIGLCALREEAREQIENLRHESASRIRMLKERLDHTDRELLRQLEESHSLDNNERVEALTALIESKADKDVAERWVESSEALHMELQALHVRTQTIGQGLKVVLGWVEGVADRVTGLQGAQQRTEHRVHRIASEAQEHASSIGDPDAWMASMKKALLVEMARAPPPPMACYGGAPTSTPSTADRPRTSGGFMNAGAPPRRRRARAAAPGRLAAGGSPRGGRAQADEDAAAHQRRRDGGRARRRRSRRSRTTIGRRRRCRAPRPSAAASTSTRAAARLSSSGCRALATASACRPPPPRPSATAAAAASRVSSRSRSRRGASSWRGGESAAAVSK